MAKMDLPPEFVFEYQGKENTLSAQSFERPVKVDTTSSAEETEPDDAARSGEFSRSPSDQEKLKRKVTFANEPSLPEEGEDSEDEADEDEQQRYMKMRYKRSASLPSIELNRELARKIRRMLKVKRKMRMISFTVNSQASSCLKNSTSPAAKSSTSMNSLTGTCCKFV